MAGVKKTRSRCQPNARKTSSCQSVTSRNKESSKQDQRFHISLKQLQAKIEAESQQVQETIQSLLDAENSFLKEVECFLTQQEVAELRRKEFLHRRWTERVWLPVQKRVEEHVSSCRRRQSLCYLRHCNSKDFVSLGTYDPQDYNQFLLKKPQYFKIKTVDLSKHPVFSYKKTKNTMKCTGAFSRPPIFAPSPASLPIKNLPEADQNTSGRLNPIPLHICATEQLKDGCWLLSPEY